MFNPYIPDNTLRQTGHHQCGITIAILKICVGQLNRRGVIPDPARGIGADDIKNSSVSVLSINLVKMRVQCVKQLDNGPARILSTKTVQINEFTLNGRIFKKSCTLDNIAAVIAPVLVVVSAELCPFQAFPRITLRLALTLNTVLADFSETIVVRNNMSQEESYPYNAKQRNSLALRSIGKIKNLPAGNYTPISFALVP